MPTNVGPTYGMYVGQTSYQRCMSNMSYVGTTLRQHVGPTMAQRANLRWANVICQRWAKGVANQNNPLVQRYHAIWVWPGIYITRTCNHRVPIGPARLNVRVFPSHYGNRVSHYGTRMADRKGVFKPIPYTGARTRVRVFAIPWSKSR